MCGGQFIQRLFQANSLACFLIFQVKVLEIIQRVSFIFIVIIINPLFAQVKISLRFKSHIQETPGIFFNLIIRAFQVAIVLEILIL